MSHVREDKSAAESDLRPVAAGAPWAHLEGGGNPRQEHTA